MKPIAVVLIGILFSGCSLGEDSRELKGSFCNCAKDGLYSEIHLGDSIYISSNSLNQTTRWSNYQVSNDTIWFTDRNTNPDSVRVNIAKWKIEDSRRLILDYLTSDEHWEFERIPDLETEEGSKRMQIAIGTSIRALELQCVDTRTKEEIRRDSINSQLEFRF